MDNKRVQKALARLERFQSKKSWDVRVTARDYEAVATVAEHIIDMIPPRYHDCILPRGYNILNLPHYGTYTRYPRSVRAVMLRWAVIEFARDLHTGLLQEIAEWILEKRKKEVQK